MGRKTGEREKQIEEMIGDQKPGLQAPSRSRKGGKRGGSKGNVRGGAMKKSRYVRVIEAEEIRRDDPFEYFLPKEVGSTS